MKCLKWEKQHYHIRYVRYFTLFWYPYSWSKNFLVPVFKSGTPDNPDNYRGVSVGSCVVKVYSMVLFNRLINATNKFNLLSKNQIDFIKGYRTTDHTFIINSTVDHFVKL